MLQLRVEDAIGLVTLDRPPHNALGPELVAELDGAITRMERDDVRVIVITGAGGAFSMGAEVHRVLEWTPARARAVCRLGQRCFDRIEASPRPVIAAIDGICLGAGLELALACHVRIASARARLALPEITLGVFPGLGGTRRLRSVVGPGLAYELILTGRTLRAPEALAIGLVNRVVEPDRLADAALRLAKRIAAKTPAAVAAAMRCLHLASRASDAEHVRVEQRLFVELGQAPESRRALASLAAVIAPAPDDASAAHEAAPASP